MLFKNALLFSILFSLLKFSNSAFAQSDNETINPIRHRYFIFTTPVQKNTQINGLAIGLMSIPWGKATQLKINGVNFELNFGGLFVWPYPLIGSIAALSRDTIKQGKGDRITNYFAFEDSISNIETTVNGLSLSIAGSLSDTKHTGVSINGIFSFVHFMKGLNIAGLTNFNYSFEGVAISGLRNKCTKGKGLQIGLFNTCKTGQVLQIGLVNRIGDRTYPLINFKR